MRKGFIAVGVILLMVGLASSLQAGGIINKQNLSADYIRTLNRNAATDMADAVAFNPAGTAMMQDGLYLKADAIYLMKDYSNKLPSSPPFNLGTLDSEEPSIIPGLFAVYKNDRWACFFGVTIPGAVGRLLRQHRAGRAQVPGTDGHGDVGLRPLGRLRRTGRGHVRRTAVWPSRRVQPAATGAGARRTAGANDDDPLRVIRPGGLASHDRATMS
jgi:hypothetical protein